MTQFKLKKYFTPLNIIFGLEIIVVALAAAGLIPREAILFWTGLAVFYMIFSPVKDSLWLVIASIPLFAALPISDSFDTMANWRILIAVLFLCLFFKEGIALKSTSDSVRPTNKLTIKSAIFLNNLTIKQNLVFLIIRFLAQDLLR